MRGLRNWAGSRSFEIGLGLLMGPYMIYYGPYACLSMVEPGWTTREPPRAPEAPSLTPSENAVLEKASVPEHSAGFTGAIF